MKVFCRIDYQIATPGLTAPTPLHDGFPSLLVSCQLGASVTPGRTATKITSLPQDALPAKDIGRAEQAGGTLTIEQWFQNASEGRG